MSPKSAMASCLLLTAAPLHAQPISEFDALVDILRDSVAAQNGAAELKSEPAEIYSRPYLADDTRWEKTARTDWYAAQLPEGFPDDGNVSVLYLERCRPNLPSGDLFAGVELDAEFYRATDHAVVMEAFEAKGVADLPLTPLGARTSWWRDSPDPGLRTVNATLQERFESGALTERIAIFEPFCPSSERGSYDQWVEGGRRGPPPPPPPPHPPPPPPPPSGPPTVFDRPPNTRVLIISELKAQICRTRTGSYYSRSCGGWDEVFGPSLLLPGRYYRYRVETEGRPPRVGGPIDLYTQPGPIDLNP